LLVELTREGKVVSAFQATHDKFRRYHDDCLRLVALAASEEQAFEELVRTLDSYAQLFHEHHEAEDDYLFPALRREEPALDVTVDKLARQHVRLAAQLDLVLEHVADIRSDSATEREMTQLAHQLTELQAMVEEHLVFEEGATVPVIETWSSWPV